jgi:putative tryptophan/tyrosine transport system substrate-binding protein
MTRREFIAGLGAAAWPLPARAQQQDGRVRRIGILDGGPGRLGGAMRDRLTELGWIEGRNARFDLLLSAGDPDRLGAYADELVRLAPDVIGVVSGPAAQALVQRTRTIPIVFTNVGDPVAIGLLKNIARPEGNATGITNQYQSLGGKWLELLKEAAPRTTRVAIIFAPENVNDQYFGVIEAAADALAVKAIRTPYRNAAELERAIDAFAVEPNGGLVMVPPPPPLSNRELINRLALKYRLPTIYSFRSFAAEGAMMGYGSDDLEVSRIAATYVDRVLRGAKIIELPVQFPTKFDLVINLKTARALGLTVPQSILLRADEVIE